MQHQLQTQQKLELHLVETELKRCRPKKMQEFNKIEIKSKCTVKRLIRDLYKYHHAKPAVFKTHTMVNLKRKGKKETKSDT